MNDAEKIKKVRALTGLSQAKYANFLGVHRYKITDTEMGRIKINTELAAAIEEKQNISFNWLMRGVGDMFLPPDDEETRKGLIETDQAGQKIGASISRGQSDPDKG